MSKMTHHETESQKIVVAAMYKFVHLPDFRVLREKLVQVCEKQSLKGTLLLAEEGINGTVQVELKKTGQAIKRKNKKKPAA